MGLSVVDLESPSVVEDVRRACEEIGFLVIAGSLVFFHSPREDAYIEALGTTGGEYIPAKAAQAFG